MAPGLMGHMTGEDQAGPEGDSLGHPPTARPPCLPRGRGALWCHRSCQRKEDPVLEPGAGFQSVRAQEAVMLMKIPQSRLQGSSFSLPLQRLK